jgi:hypothetical protein
MGGGAMLPGGQRSYAVEPRRTDAHEPLRTSDTASVKLQRQVARLEADIEAVHGAHAKIAEAAEANSPVAWQEAKEGYDRVRERAESQFQIAKGQVRGVDDPEVLGALNAVTPRYVAVMAAPLAARPDGIRRLSVEPSFEDLRSRPRPDDVSHKEWAQQINQELASAIQALSDEDAKALRARLANPIAGDALAKWINSRNNASTVRTELGDSRRRQRERERAAAGTEEEMDAVEEALYDAGPTDQLPDACVTDLPTISPDAVSGIQLWLHFDKSIYRSVDQRSRSAQFGPDRAGPYRLMPFSRDGGLMFFIAEHEERAQSEWVIGPDSVWTFADGAAMYAGAAARLLPGSPAVRGSQADGADQVRDPDSLVKKEAFGEAPWQRALDVADTTLDHAHGGGGAFVFARNARLRINDYVKPAQELSDQLARDVAAGKVHHLDARARAVQGRNDLLEHTRRRQSPAARFASKKVKEEGKTVGGLVERKVTQGLDKYRTSEATRRVLDADSALWAKCAAAVESGEATMEAALRELGESPEVSRAIIESAGKTNSTFTRLAKWGGPIALGAGVLAAADMVFDVADDLEAHNWHAAAGELAGFAGGVLGGEVGSMGAVWMASAILGPGGGIVIVASVIGAIAGGMVGARAGETLVDAIADGAAFGAGFGAPFAAAGGFGGVHEKDHPAGYRAADQLADAIFAIDAELADVSRAIPHAQDRKQMEALQKMRLEVLSRRQHLEDLLTALKLGLLDQPDTATACEVPVAPPVDECAIDADCDKDFD